MVVREQTRIDKEQHTITLNDEGVKIPGIEVSDIKKVYSLPEKRNAITKIITDTLTCIANPRSPEENKQFDFAIHELKKALYDIKKLGKKALCICEKSYMQNGKLTSNDYKDLSLIDQKILNHPAKEVAAMVFRLATTTNSREKESPVNDSVILYTAILQAIEKNILLIDTFY